MLELNKAPYNDDYNPDKNYHRVLFVPGTNIQARELNVMQSMMKNQIASVSNHLFKNGAKISGCSTKFIQYDYVRLNDSYIKNDVSSEINLSQYNNTSLKLIGETSKVEAKIIDVQNKTLTDSAALYVIYTKTGIDNLQSTFIPGENIDFYDSNNIKVYSVTVRCPSCPGNTVVDDIDPTGKSMFFNIEEGIFYYNGNFIKLQKQHYIIEKYLTKDSTGSVISSMTYRVGLNVVESFVTAIDDNSLFDNSLGYPNFAAPGADRHKIELKLVIKDYVESNDDSDFILLAKVRQNHTVEYKKDDTDYGQIMDEIARRTYETSGNFALNQWKTKFLNEKKQNSSDTLGWTESGNDDNFVAIISPGTGYVKGYRVSNPNETIVSGRKARDTKKIRGAASSIGNMASFTIKSDNVAWIQHNNKSTISDLLFNLFDSNKSSIGSVKAYDIVKITDTTYKFYFYDLNIISGSSLGNAVTIEANNSSMKGELVESSIEYVNNTALIYNLGIKSLKTIRDNDNQNNGNTNVYIRKKINGLLDSSGNISFTGTTNELYLSFEASNILCWIGNSPNGTEVKLQSSNVTIDSSNLKISMGSSNAGKSITIILNVLKSAQQESTKTLTSYVEDITLSSNQKNILLSKCDGYKLVSVTSNDKNITDKFNFLSGQTDNFYENASLTTNEYFKDKEVITVTYQYFEHSGNSGFFTVDSYSQLINDDTLNLEYSDIPTYTNSSNVTVRLSECIDFRIIKNANEQLDTNSCLPVFGSTVTFDAEYYLGRCDLLQVNSEGAFYFKEGVSSENPILPDADPNAMVLYNVYINAYVYDLNDINSKYVDNKRFSMKDISKIEQRLSNIEYAVSLSLLESQTVNMSIKDSNGLDRYKNGYLVDNYTTYYGVDISNVEFKACLDRTGKQLRPQYSQDNIRLLFDESKSNNIQTFGNVAMNKFQSDLFIQNTYATQTLSINPYMVFRRNGSMTLSPNIDTWSDTTNLPAVSTDIDSGTEALKEVATAAGLLSTDYSSWVDMNSSIIGSSSVTNSSTGTMGGVGETVSATTTTNTIQTTSQRTATSKTIGSKTQSYTIDDIVKDVSISPYIRSNTVQFYASNLKPNTTIFAFFDGMNVSDHCKQIKTIDTNQIASRNDVMFGGSPLVTDDNGSIIGEFRIPEKTFFTGEKKFVLTNDSGNTGNSDVETTRCESTYFAGGVSQSKQSSTLNVITPTYTTETSTESKTSTSVSRSTTVTKTSASSPSVVTTVASGSNVPAMPDYTPKGKWSNHFHWVLSGNSWHWDPVAQGFSVDESCFISKVGVYFAQTDLSSNSVWFEIREMVNGYPSSVAITHKDVDINIINKYTSNDASKEYQVEFDVPVYVDSSKTYAFVIGGYSPDTRVYIAHLGDKILGTDNSLEQPPLKYTMFRSLNGETWNAQQYDTLKINIYRCVFDTSETTFVFKNDNLNHNFNKLLDKNPIYLEKGSNNVKINVKNHGLRVNDRILLDLNTQLYHTIEITSGMPQIGQPASTLTMSGYVSDIQLTDTLNVYKISFKNVSGHFEKLQEITFESRKYEYRDLVSMYSTGVVENNITQNQSTGFIKDVDISDINLAGADISLFAKEHIIKQVNSIDEVQIQVDASYNSSGYFGGSNVRLGTNIKLDMFNISGQYMMYDVSNSWNIEGKSFTDNNTINKAFNPSVDTYLDDTAIIINDTNEKRLLGSNSSSLITIKAKSENPYISPVINTDSLSMTCVSNRIDWIEKDVISETDPINGNEKFKSVTTLVMLENPASDMKIIFDVYCSSVSDFDVYVKCIDDNWIKIDNFVKKTPSNTLNDFMEYDLQLSKNCTKWSDNIEFSKFRIKLVGRSKKSSQPVIFQNFRAIAIT